MGVGLASSMIRCMGRVTLLGSLICGQLSPLLRRLKTDQLLLSVSWYVDFQGASEARAHHHRPALHARPGRSSCSSGRLFMSAAPLFVRLFRSALPPFARFSSMSAALFHVSSSFSLLAPPGVSAITSFNARFSARVSGYSHECDARVVAGYSAGVIFPTNKPPFSPTPSRPLLSFPSPPPPFCPSHRPSHPTSLQHELQCTLLCHELLGGPLPPILHPYASLRYNHILALPPLLGAWHWRSCVVEMVGSAVEMAGSAVEMVGSAVEMVVSRAESKLPCWIMLLSLFPSITPLVFIAPVSSSLPIALLPLQTHCALSFLLALPFLMHRPSLRCHPPFPYLTLPPGIADIVGRRVGSAKLPWNDEKSWAGSMAMLLFGYGLALFTIHLFIAAGFYSSDWLLLPNLPLRVFLVSLGATVVESLPISDKLDDNLTVPLSTVLFGLLLLQQ
ncbi:unnamed protein product [Closterium sp. NIES-65]|nr:unnamed protein product [Closterium sp. NIES-65]